MSETSHALRVFREGVPGGPAQDTAVSRALLEEVADGASDGLRLWRPERALAFSTLDRTRPGFDAALRASKAHGFPPFVRLAGGHAAAYAPSLLAFAWARQVDDARAGIEARFRDVAERVVAALAALRVDARIGEVPGEYCPGEWSVNARGRVKLMGVGQRVVRGAVHIGGVLQVAPGPDVVAALVDVYRALGLEFRPESFGDVEGECGADHDAVSAALLSEFGRDHDLVEAVLPEHVHARAGALVDRHDVD